ncbi:NADH dehydrogenase [ubiquinone] 1 alpha subcomplex subunit 7 [Nomia melanderi]|uniref:NADH dehydrogenase [ubiquinone] 1 alpha subcomplex subunit 7 n=1 Tax=Nomia melanderi TaxID=2448451 RepID=UPI0013042AC8|nr:NADH dehydrogenase [ubiquinone] 1 alpha subcomplex subunit 7-like [Nomia melanderi]
MPSKVEPRTAIPLVKMMRNLLRGRRVVEAVRFPCNVADRTQPPPTIPYGPNHKTSKVYYYTRDARRLVQPPIAIYSATKQLEAGKGAPSEVKYVTPGKVYNPPTQ